MARKNIFDLGPENDDSLTRVNEADANADLARSRPLAGIGVDRVSKPSALGAISQSLEKISERSAKAKEIEKLLSAGDVVVELDVELLESSFISDRLEFDDGDQSKLTQQIREMGQMVPILVRPHPVQDGRYQIAFGHRRVAAARELGRKVKATVKPLSDEELIIHQGQENNTRSGLSFIEKAFFILALENRGYSRETMHQSTGLDKAILSKMITFVSAIPEAVVRRIGRAPSIGRKRWEKFVSLLDGKGRDIAIASVGSEGFQKLTSDERFEFVLDRLKSVEEVPAKNRGSKISRPELGAGLKPLAILRAGDRTQFTFDENVAPEFAAFVQSRLEQLFKEYEAEKDG
jgi:ParB family chromosome partitioning protein